MTESPIVNEWREQVGNERELKGLGEAACFVLNERFPDRVPSDVVATIMQQPSLEVMRDWVRKAAVLPLDEFQAYLRR